MQSQTDHFIQRVRFVNHATGIMSTVVGTGTPGYNGEGLRPDSAELLYAMA